MPRTKTTARKRTGTSRRVQKVEEPEESDDNMAGNEDDNEDNDDAHGLVASGSSNASTYVKFSKAAFVNQPIDVTYEKLLKTTGASWANPAKEIKDRGLALLADTARALEDAGGDDELLEQLDQAMRKMIDTSNNVKVHQQAIEAIRQQLLRKEDVSDLLNVYNERAGQAKEEYNKKTARQKYAKDDAYSKFRSGIWDGRHNESRAMPPDFIAQNLLREEGDEGEESDDDIIIGGQTQGYKCPITLLYLIDPLTSKVCGHSYSRQAIMDYLKDNAPKACPETSCDSQVSKNDLEENRDLARAARRAKQTEEDMEEEVEDEAEEVED